jgi:hypothetical protein
MNDFNTFAATVPEPSGMLLVVCVATLGLYRRRLPAMKSPR